MNKRLGLVVILSVLVLGAFAAESGTGKVGVAVGAGVEIGLAGLSVNPVVEVNYKASDLFKVGGRIGASMGTYQGQDWYLTGAVRGYLSWVYAEIGGSYQLATLPAADANHTKLQASGLIERILDEHGGGRNKAPRTRSTPPRRQYANGGAR